MASIATLAAPRPTLAQEGAVFTATNASLANSVIMYNRANNGKLTPIGEWFTGGTGTGAGIGTAGAVILSPDHSALFVTNAGSNDISAFAVQPDGLTLVSRTPSGGTTPFSLTLSGNLLYVVNGGTPANITGFKVNPRNGKLTPIPGSTQRLSQAVVKPGQIKFSPFGNLLVVTEQNTNNIDVFPVNAEGVAQSAVVVPSEGDHPFGFDFDPAGHLLISEAVGSAASSYYVSTYGILPISASVLNNQAAACWLLASLDGRYAWTANAASDNISAYTIAPNGALALIHANNGIAASLPAGSHPLDMAQDGNGHFYVLDEFTGSVTALNIHTNGTLSTIGTYGDTTTYGTGLAAY